MENQVDNKFTWVIKNFSTLQSEKIYSDEFVIGGCKWRLLAYPKGNKSVDKFDKFSLYAKVADYEYLPAEWRRHAKVSFTVVNQTPGKPSHQAKTEHLFDSKVSSWGFPSILSLNELYAVNSGFLVWNELKIVVEIEVLEVIGKLDVTVAMGSMDIVNGFQVLSSQVKSVKRLFEKHPQFASSLRVKNKHMKTGHMNVLLSLIETLRQSPKKISKDDLSDANAALESVNDAGFKLDWLEKKLNKVSKVKVKEEACEMKIKDLEKELKDLKQKCLDVEDLLEKEKAELLVTGDLLSEDDIC